MKKSNQNPVTRYQNITPKKTECSMNDVVDICDITRPSPKKVYHGLEDRNWKNRFYNHKLSFKYKKYSNKTMPSSYMGHLKRVSCETPKFKVVYFDIRTTILKCLLHLHGKLEITRTKRNQKEPERTLEQELLHLL